MDWLIDETPSFTAVEVAASLPAEDVRLRGSGRANLAILMNDLVIHDTKKLFGGAAVRLDAIVVHGPPSDPAQGAQFYQPATFRFSDVRDGDRLPIEPPGLLVFYGRPRDFLAINIMASRDRDSTPDLGSLISTGLTSTQWQQATGELLGLAVGAPAAAAIVSATTVARVIGNLVAEFMKAITGNTIGVYRTAYLQYKHRFGLGRHPENDNFRREDFSFWYEIVADRASSG